MDPSLLRALTHHTHRRRRRPAQESLLPYLVVVNPELSDTVTQSVVLGQRSAADGPIVSSRYRR